MEVTPALGILPHPDRHHSGTLLPVPGVSRPLLGVVLMLAEGVVEVTEQIDHEHGEEEGEQQDQHPADHHHQADQEEITDGPPVHGSTVGTKKAPEAVRTGAFLTWEP